jgi:hypothetical protein
LTGAARILVTGSRFYADRVALWAAMDAAAGGRVPVVVHGRCDPREAWGDRDPVRWNRAMMRTPRERLLLLGADWQAHLHAERMGWPEEPYPALWRMHGRRAGFVRNADMVALGAHVCVAALEPGEPCKGTRMCAELAVKAGIRVVWVGESA